MAIAMLIAMVAMAALFNLWAALVTFISYFVGLVGWFQILSSIRCRNTKGWKVAVLTVLLWVVILATFFAALYFLTAKLSVAYLIGLAIAFAGVLRHKDIL